MRKELSQLESSKDREVTNIRHWQTLERKYSIRVKTLGLVTEEMKERIVAIAAKVRRYQEGQIGSVKTKCFRINRGSFMRN